jgi:hypothetical protein
MKIFAFIMAVLLISLSCIPCADSGNIHSAKMETGVVKHDANQPHEDHEDACSPFCTCACCANYSINCPTNTIEVPAIAGKSFISFLSDNIIEISLPIWQPPRL